MKNIINLVSKCINELELECLKTEKYLTSLNSTHGLYAQIVNLRILRADIHSSLNQSSTLPPNIFSRLVNIFTLCPGSASAEKLIRDVFKTVNNDVLEKLNGYNNDVLFCHVSCNHLLDIARESVSSFSGLKLDVSHLIIVGSSSFPNDIRIELSDNILRLPVGDTYEFLAIKTFYLWFTLSLLKNVRLVAKLDDDSRLQSPSLLALKIKWMLRSKNDCFGFPHSPGSHSSYAHHWHVGKCRDKQYETIGLCTPLPAFFPSGGNTYFLKSNALTTLAFAYLSYQSYLYTLMFAEDVALGQIILTHQLRFISLGSNPLKSLGISNSEHHLTFPKQSFADHLEHVKLFWRLFGLRRKKY